jgi:D-glucosaminate-6-phosphate ammonia-lyase
MSIYEEIGVKRVINAAFCLTVLGGSTLTEEVIDAMSEANECFVEMKELCGKAGEIIAAITGAEAAYPTTGAFGSLVLSAAACIAGKDPDQMRLLPDTTNMKNEIIIQKNLRIVFDRAMEVPGGKFVVIEPTLRSMEEAISEKTAAIHYTAPVPEDPQRTDVIPIEEVINLGHKHGVPIIVDAAGQTYPINRLKMFASMGADLICHSGKYFSAPNSTGYVCGRKDLIEAVEANSYIGPGVGWIGRGYKLDRQEVIALIVALRRWVKMDHDKERFQPARDRRDHLIKALKDVPDITLAPQPYRYHAIDLQITLDKKTADETTKLVKLLREGDPSIRIRSVSENNLLVNTMFLMEDDVPLLAERLKAVVP